MRISGWSSDVCSSDLATYNGQYFSGDGCRRDEDDYYWITGRVDDVINVSGHRMGTAEVESALVSHPLVAEAAVVGYPHDIKRSEEHTSELQSLMRISYAVFCLKKKKDKIALAHINLCST